jgi:hypothetical protein
MRRDPRMGGPKVGKVMSVAEHELWAFDYVDGSLNFATDELEALAVCFPALDLRVVLTPETFAAAVWDAVYVEHDGSIDDECRQDITQALDLWRRQIAQLQARIDALPAYQTPPKRTAP